MKSQKNKNLNRQKIPSDVWGKKNKCPNFIECKICFGCRNFSSNNLICTTHCDNDFDKCEQKNNLHRDDLVNKISSKSHLIIN